MRLPIPGHAGYEITEAGVVYRLARIGKHVGLIKEKTLKSTLSSYGYLYVSLQRTNDRKWRHEFVHRLVAKAFLPTTDHSLVINHKDGNKTNNHPENLEWVTLAQNNRHARESGLSSYIPSAGRGSDHPLSKITERQAAEIKQAAWSGESQAAIAARYGIVRQLVSQIKHGQAWAHIQ